MLFWSIKVIILSVTLIFLVHYLINFFKSTLTVPKVKDLVNVPTQKYENIFNIIQRDKQSSVSNMYTNNQNTYTNGTDINLLPSSIDINSNNTSQNNNNNINNNNNKGYSNSMKNELKGFLKKQLNEDNNSNNSNNINNINNNNTNHVHFMESSTVNSYSSL